MLRLKKTSPLVSADASHHVIVHAKQRVFLPYVITQMMEVSSTSVPGLTAEGGTPSNTIHTAPWTTISTQQSCVLRLWRASTQKPGTKRPLFASYFTRPSHFHGPCPVKSPPAWGTNSQEVPATYTINKIYSSSIANTIYLKLQSCLLAIIYSKIYQLVK